VWSHVVNFLTEGIELALLSDQTACRRSGGLRLEGAMHAFMAAVLLGLAWFDEFREHAETDPPMKPLMTVSG
jgi:hypothetical protein